MVPARCFVDNGKTANGLIKVIREATRRKKYAFRENFIIAALAGSKYKGEFWKQVPDFMLVDEMIEAIYINKIQSDTIIYKEILEKYISSVVSKMILDAKESSYLSIIPTLISKPVDIRKCISENQMRELEQLEYSVGANLLTVKLLKMCMSNDNAPDQLFGELFQCDISREVVYLELETMLRYCMVQNKEKLWVEMYLRLEDEEFEESGAIRKRILNDMIEAKCNAAKG